MKAHRHQTISRFTANNPPGFSFIEVLTVLLIVGIISAIVVSRFTFGDSDLIAQTEVIKSHLRYAQSQAMNSDAIWGITSNGSSYWLFKDGDPNDRVRLPGEAADTKSLTEKGLSMESFILSYDNRGIPHTDAVAGDGQELASGDGEEQITVSDGTNSRTITVTPNTGFIP